MSVLGQNMSSEDLEGRESPVRRNMLQDLRERHGRPRLITRRLLPEHTAGKDDPSTLTVMQWNCLAMALSQPKVCLFQCEYGSLDWSSRRALILEEMIQREANLIACQEMDDFDFFSDALASLGYEGFFAPKPRSPCLRQTVNIGADGCAIFFSKHRFVKLDSGSKILSLDGGKKESNSVVAWVVLRDIISQVEMTFMTTHLKSGTEQRFAQIREQQTMDLIEVIGRLAERTPSLILCGDFNGEPGERFYQLLRSMKKVKLNSAYEVLGSTEPRYTTWKIREDGTGEKKRCIDYVFYTSSPQQRLTPLAVLDLPSDEDVGPLLRFPRLNFPSDHLDLLVKFTVDSVEAL